MIQSRVIAAAVLAVVFVAGGARAGDKGGLPSNPISWDEFRARCANPDSFENQRDPRAIRIECTNIERDWAPDAPGTVELSANRRVVTAVFSDKFHVNAIEREYPVGRKPGSCLRYREIEKVITIEKPMTCGDVLGLKGDITEFCAGALDTAKGTNPKMIDVRETGNRRDTCGGPVEKK